MKRKIRHRIDPPTVSSDEALEFMVHHLTLAAAYYEATEDNEDANFAEIRRLMDSHIDGYQSPCLLAATAWFEAIRNHYTKLKERDEEFHP